MKAKSISAFLFYSFLVIKLNAQVGISTDNTLPHPSALLDIKSSNKGLLLPRISTPSTSIASPAAGLMVYDQEKANLAYFNGSSWNNISAGNTSLHTRFPNSKGFTAPFSTISPFTENYDFVVPAGISKVWVEAWGGGTKGSTGTVFTDIYGGDGGDYISVILPVVAGNTMEIKVSKGQKVLFEYGYTQVLPNKINENNYITARYGGGFSDFEQGIPNAELLDKKGGNSLNYGKISYQNLGSTGFIFLNDTNGEGAFPAYQQSPSNTFIYNTAKVFVESYGSNVTGTIPGGGGPAVASGNSYGAPGLVILHW